MSIKYNTIFCKKGNMVYISHLDLMTVLRRAIRRAELPFVLTGGFTPRVKISIPEALKLGTESEKEHLSIWFEEEVDPGKIMKDINSELPEGIKILEVSAEKN